MQKPGLSYLMTGDFVGFPEVEAGQGSILLNPGTIKKVLKKNIP
jgi:hypothetical protein